MSITHLLRFPAAMCMTCSACARALCSVGLNKGGVAVSFKLDDTHLAFVSSHLAAHQSKTAQRNSDVGEICANLKLLPPAQRRSVHKPDLATGFHHCVWVGDLNYRLEYGQQVSSTAVYCVECMLWWCIAYGVLLTQDLEVGCTRCIRQRQHARTAAPADQLHTKQG
jgi:hypothetical protein